MVARIVSGKSIRGVLVYNETKVRNAEAQLLMAAGFPRHPDALSFKNKLDRFDMLTSQNERTKTNALHITLNFSRDDRVDDDLLCCIAKDYMDAIGFGSQPYLVYRHYDASHPHIHLATVVIADGGERIETHNIGKHQSEKARKSIEIKYNLVKAEDQKNEQVYMLKPVKLEGIEYGKIETKAAISGIVREVVGNYKFTSLPELNAVLRQFNIVANRGDPGSIMHEHGGLTYHILNERGEKVGVPIKASSIYSSPTLKNLEKKYGRNKEERKPYSLRLKHLLDKAIREATGLEDFQKRLRTHGIRVLLRENAMGSIYGVTFIDNGTRSVFKGSSLGKEYSAKPFLQRIGFDREALSGVSGDELTEAQYPAQQQPIIQVIWDAALSDREELTTYDPYRKKKRRQRRKIEPD